jgi:hypothetical protein
MKRRVILTVTVTLLTLTVICQCSCSSCHKPQPVSADLVLEGEIGHECNFATMAANGHQSIDILVTDNKNFGRHYQVSNVPNLKYPIEIPSKGNWQIIVRAIETDKKSCPSCSSICSGQTQGRPTWEATKSYQGGGVTGTYNVVLQFPSTYYAGGPCPCS